MATTHHDCINRHYPVYTGRRFIRRWAVGRSEKFLKRARVVLTQSEHAAADIQHLLGVPGDRLKVIPAWLPPEYSLQVARAAANGVRRKYDLPEHYWLYVGGYDVRKNVEFLIRAYAAARKTTPCPPLVLAGKIPGHTAPTLCDVHGSLRDAGLSRDEVITPGFIDDADLPGLYGGAGLFLYPSLLEVLDYHPSRPWVAAVQRWWRTIAV